MKRIPILYFIIFASTTFYPAVLIGESSDEEQSLFYILNFNNRLGVKRNFLNSDKPYNLSFTDDSYGYYFYSGIGIIWFTSDDTELDLTLNSGTVKFENLYYENQQTVTSINDKDAVEYIKKSLFVDELFIENDSLVDIKVGKMNINNATSFVFNDYVFAARAEIPLYRGDKKGLF